MRLALLAILLLIQPGQLPEGALSLASYNLNAANPGQESTLAALEALDVDVLVLQEASSAWQAAIRERLGERYREIRFVSYRQSYGSLGVLSKHPIVRAEVLAPRAGPFPAMWIELDFAGARIDLLNVHLFPPERWSVSKGWIKAYLESQALHLDELADFFEQAPRRPSLILGDFNEDELGRGVEWLLANGYRSALRERTNTWRWQTEAGEVKWPLDHVLHTRRVDVVGTFVPVIGGSDHLPVVVHARPR